MRGRTALVAGVASALILGAPAASFGYGPGGGGGNGGPPGFGETLTSDNIGTNGGKLAADVRKCHLKVTVPEGAFKKKTNVVITRISRHSANKHLGAKKRTVCAFGVGFFRHGDQVKIKHGRPAAMLDFLGDPIKSDQELRRLIPNDGSKHKNADFAAGHASSKLRATSELAIVRNVA
jgi:hypothetical protein